jgi:hypothetical membrane protein
MKHPNSRYLALGGAVGPILFTTMILICSGMRPDYDHVSDFISELGATDTPNASLMNFVGFMPTGILIASLGVALIVGLPRGFSSTSGGVLLALFGIGIMVAGIFSCDPGCPQAGSKESMIHDNVSAVAFISAIVGTGLLGVNFRRSDTWRSLFMYSIATSASALIFLITMINSFEVRMLTGMWQRLMLGVLFLWCFIVGRKLFASMN